MAARPSSRGQVDPRAQVRRPGLPAEDRDRLCRARKALPTAPKEMPLPSLRPLTPGTGGSLRLMRMAPSSRNRPAFQQSRPRRSPSTTSCANSSGRPSEARRNLHLLARVIPGLSFARRRASGGLEDPALLLQTRYAVARELRARWSSVLSDDPALPPERPNRRPARSGLERPRHGAV